MKTGTANFVCEMIDIILEYIPSKLAEARAGLKDGELGVVASAFHSIKSSVGTIGAMKLKDLAAQIERLSKEKKMEVIPALFEDFEKGYTQVEKFLEMRRRELDEGGPSSPSV